MSRDPPSVGRVVPATTTRPSGRRAIARPSSNAPRSTRARPPLPKPGSGVPFVRRRATAMSDLPVGPGSVMPTTSTLPSGWTTRPDANSSEPKSTVVRPVAGEGRVGEPVRQQPCDRDVVVSAAPRHHDPAVRLDRDRLREVGAPEVDDRPARPAAERRVAVALGVEQPADDDVEAAADADAPRVDDPAVRLERHVVDEERRAPEVLRDHPDVGEGIVEGALGLEEPGEDAVGRPTRLRVAGDDDPSVRLERQPLDGVVPAEGQPGEAVPSAERGVQRPLRGEEPGGEPVACRVPHRHDPSIRLERQVGHGVGRAAVDARPPRPQAVGRVELPGVGAELGHDAVRTTPAPPDWVPPRTMRPSGRCAIATASSEPSRSTTATPESPNVGSRSPGAAEAPAVGIAMRVSARSAARRFRRIIGRDATSRGPFA